MHSTASEKVGIVCAFPGCRKFFPYEKHSYERSFMMGVIDTAGSEHDAKFYCSGKTRAEEICSNLTSLMMKKWETAVPDQKKYWIKRILQLSDIAALFKNNTHSCWEHQKNLYKQVNRAIKILRMNRKGIDVADEDVAEMDEEVYNLATRILHSESYGDP